MDRTPVETLQAELLEPSAEAASVKRSSNPTSGRAKGFGQRRDDDRRPLARYAPHPTGEGRERARRGDDTGSPPPHCNCKPVQRLRLPVHVGLRSDGHPLSLRCPALAKEGASVSEYENTIKCHGNIAMDNATSMVDFKSHCREDERGTERANYLCSRWNESVQPRGGELPGKELGARRDLFPCYDSRARPSRSLAPPFKAPSIANSTLTHSRTAPALSLGAVRCASCRS